MLLYMCVVNALIKGEIEDHVWFEDPGGQRGQLQATWWQERQDEVMDGFLVEPQNQCRAGTTWESSHEW
jgi:hypothetical protein